MDVKYELERRYNLIKFEISMLEEQMKTVDDEAMPSLTPSYSGMPNGKGGTSDKVFNTVVKMVSNKERLQNLINQKHARLKSLEMLIGTQSHKAQIIIRARALEGKDFCTVANELKQKEGIDIYSTSRCKELYYKSMKNMQEIANNLENKGE